MLALARKYQQQVADRLGYGNVDFRYGLIQDLRLDLDLLGRELVQHPVREPSDWLELRNLEDRLRRDQPMIVSDSIDCVVSNCVLNLVRPQDRRQLFAEVFRVLRVGGRAAISDIVADETPPPHLQRSGELWSGCVSGAFREDQFLAAFEAAGFHGVELVKRQAEPWRTVEGIEFRSVTVVAYKGKQGPCLERNQAVIYRGPFKQVVDDDGHLYLRGARMAVCDKTFRLLRQPPYAGMFYGVEPRQEIPLAEAGAFDCQRAKQRDPRETKGVDYRSTTSGSDCCGGASEPCR
jgi:SAM-dependent methyltransferase